LKHIALDQSRQFMKYIGGQELQYVALLSSS